jgi:hypothetical protein
MRVARAIELSSEVRLEFEKLPECVAGALGRKVMEIIETDLTAIDKTARADWERNYSVLRYREERAEL